MLFLQDTHYVDEIADMLLRWIGSASTFTGGGPLGEGCDERVLSKDFKRDDLRSVQDKASVRA